MEIKLARYPEEETHTIEIFPNNICGYKIDKLYKGFGDKVKEVKGILIWYNANYGQLVLEDVDEILRELEESKLFIKIESSDKKETYINQGKIICKHREKYTYKKDIYEYFEFPNDIYIEI